MFFFIKEGAPGTETGVTMQKKARSKAGSIILILTAIDYTISAYFGKIPMKMSAIAASVTAKRSK